MPNRFVEVSEFPMSVTGKVQKAKFARALSSNS
jgi:hypothetical protein